MFDLSKAQKVYIAVGYSDLRRGIDGFATIIQNTFHMNPQSDALFLFCGRRCDRIKALYWDGDGSPAFIFDNGAIHEHALWFFESPTISFS